MVEDDDANRPRAAGPQHGNLDAVAGRRDEEILEDEGSGRIAGNEEQRDGRRAEKREDTEDDSFGHFDEHSLNARGASADDISFRQGLDDRFERRDRVEG